jgi:hypothetical protein
MAALNKKWRKLRYFTLASLLQNYNGMETMNCPFLIFGYGLTCKANNTYSPSRFQVDEYCRSKRKRYAVCPFFKFRGKEKKVPVE